MNKFELRCKNLTIILYADTKEQAIEKANEQIGCVKNWTIKTLDNGITPNDIIDPRN